MNATVVLLVGVQFAEVHRLDESWGAAEEGLEEAELDCGDDLTGERAKIVDFGERVFGGWLN